MAEQLLATPARFERDADRKIFLGIRNRLWQYDPLRSTSPELELSVTHGTVRIGGRVRTLAMKEIIGYLCQREEGVSMVQNNVVSDTEVVRQVAEAVATDPELGALCVKVDARGGIATITGDVPDPDLEPRVIAAARAATGVLDVVSELVVRKPERPPTAGRPTDSEAPAAPAVEKAPPA